MKLQSIIGEAAIISGVLYLSDGLTRIKDKRISLSEGYNEEQLSEFLTASKLNFYNNNDMFVCDGTIWLTDDRVLTFIGGKDQWATEEELEKQRKVLDYLGFI